MSDLSGFWVGTYSYDDVDRTPVSFDAELTHDGLQLSGIITEPNSFDHPAFKGGCELVTAELTGMVSGSHLNFVKSYTGSNVPTDPVTYDGEIDDGVSTVTGSWQIFDVTGTFEMRRDGPVVGVKVKRAEAEAGLEMKVGRKL